MPTPVAAINTPRLIALGLAKELEPSGYAVEPVADPRAWADFHPEAALLVAVRNKEDVGLLLELTRDLPSMAVIALLDPMSIEHFHLCIGAGARGCVSVEWSSDELALALEAGLRGMVIMPASLAQSLAAAEEDKPYAHSLTTTQQAWLRDLASGTTVQALATRVGFSEREMYRRLRQVYRNMGCATRTEAMIRASASGILDLPNAGVSQNSGHARPLQQH